MGVCNLHCRAICSSIVKLFTTDLIYINWKKKTS